MPEHEEISALVRQVLGDSYTYLQVKRAVIEEELEQGTTSVTCEVYEEVQGDKPESSVIAGKGVGLVDAFFRGVQTRYGEEYPSLKTIRFANFRVDAELESKKQFSGTDSLAKVTIEIANSEDRRFVFKHTARSLTGAAIITTLRALEHFINSERAFVATYHALKDAQERSRSDLVQRFTDTLAMLVRNTSYSEVIDKIKNDIP